MNDNYQLDKVVILSRHGVRTPLLNTLDFLNKATPFEWPTWNYPFGYLTTRGGALEAYFGHYFSLWLAEQKVMLSTDNPEIFVYANSLQRTVATAQFFVTGAFAGQDIRVNHKYPIERMDPIFDPSLREDSAEFKQKIFSDIDKANISKTIFADLVPAYEFLSEILDYRHSQLYAKYQCDLADIPTKINLNLMQEPSISGPLAIGTAVADAFLLQYYSAFPKDQIAWGKVKSDEQWQQIVNIRNQYINLLCHSETLAKHIALPLIQMISHLMLNESFKVSFLVGHDSNIAALFGALKFKNYTLPKQFEQTPIGGKVVLQRFRHKMSEQLFFKAEYVYQSFEQIHFGQPLDLNNPPQKIDLIFENASQNSDGFYDWYDFEKRIKSESSISM